MQRYKEEEKRKFIKRDTYSSYYYQTNFFFQKYIAMKELFAYFCDLLLIGTFYIILHVHDKLIISNTPRVVR